MSPRRSAERIELVERLGAGGMAEVWMARAVDVAGARPFAAKLPLPHLAEDARFVDAFVREAELSSKLDHPNIVKTLGLTTIGGRPALLLELLEGKSIRELMGELSQGASPALAVQVALGVARALDYAHAAGPDRPALVHRDVSPSNILVGSDGAVHLLDFGLAKALDGASDERTRRGALKGKLGYLSPERLDGEPADAASDLFAVGVVLWEMLTARRLYAAAALAELRQLHAVRPPPPSRDNPNVPAALDEICARCLAHDVNARYHTAAQLIAALQPIADQLPWQPADLAWDKSHASLTASTFGDTVVAAGPRRRLPLVVIAIVVAMGAALYAWPHVLR